MQSLVWFLCGCLVSGYIMYQIGFDNGAIYATSTVVEDNTISGEVGLFDDDVLRVYINAENVEIVENK